MTAGVSIIFDNTVPLGTESLQLGPQRIKATPENILKLLLGVATDTTFQSPFSTILNPDSSPELQMVNEPTADASVATKRYSDQRAHKLSATGGPTAFTVADAGLPSTFTPSSNQVFVLVCDAAFDGSAAPTLSINGAGPYALKKMDGTTISDPNDLRSGTYYLLTWDGAAYRVQGFIGGTLTQALILSGDPAVALGAATKQYVDNRFDLIMDGAAVAGVKWNILGTTVIMQWASKTISGNPGTSLHGGPEGTVPLVEAFPAQILLAIPTIYCSTDTDVFVRWTGNVGPDAVDLEYIAVHGGNASTQTTLRVLAIGV